MPACFVEKFFANGLQFTKGEWKGLPFKLLPWQRRIVRRVFTTVDPATGLRIVRTVYVEIPRKNGKSEWGAGMGLALFYTDDEPGAEIYSCAGDRDQAAIIFEIAKQMVEANPKLAAISKIYKRAIVIESEYKTYRVISSDARLKHGFNPHGIIFDELHTQPNRELWDVMRTGTGARRQPLTIALTTAGYDKNSICYEVHDYAKKVLDGSIEDPSFDATIFAAGDDADYTNPNVWKRANPSLGHTIKREYIEGECQRAEEIPAYQNTFRRLHLNQWTEQDVRWLDMSRWRACEGKLPTPEELSSRRCFGGLDLSSTQDITALVLYFPATDDELAVCLCRFWIPELNITDRSKRGRVPYDGWAREGFLTPTEGNTVDYTYIRREINELAEQYRIEGIAVDRWNSSSLVTQLTEDGANIVLFGQGFASMTTPSRELERVVIDKELNHGGNPVLTWMAGNVSVKQDPAGNLKPDKAKSREKIDGMVALIMAIGFASQTPEEKVSKYAQGAELTVI